MRLNPPKGFQAVGLRYFNVYGPREQHKGRMASVAYHFFHQYRQQGRLKLFEGSGGYQHGEQRRDFVAVEDVVKVNMYLLEHPGVTGAFFNVGTGKSHSFNDVAMAVINTIRDVEGEQPLTLAEAIASEKLSYIPMPEALQGKYQSFTEADISVLRACGYEQPFDDVAQGVRRYVRNLLESSNPR